MEITGSQNLMAFNNAFIEKRKSKSGEMIECVTIPLKQNFLEVYEGKKKGIYINLRAVESKQERSTHFMKQSVKNYSELSEEEKKTIPITINLKVFSETSGQQDGSKISPSQNFSVDSDDLPF